MFTEKDARDIAYATKQYIEAACGDIAYGCYSIKDADESIPGFAAKVKQSGIRDWKGCYADELYNDRGTVRDLAGDKIYWMLGELNIPAWNRRTKSSSEEFYKIADELNSMLHFKPPINWDE